MKPQTVQLAAAIMCGLCIIAGAILAANAAASHACYEDEPCWNWAKMGNLDRGVVALDGTPKVVGPCGFNRLWAHGAIRYRLHGERLMPRLRGDKFARSLTDCPWRNREGKPYPWSQSPGTWATKRGY